MAQYMAQEAIGGTVYGTRSHCGTVYGTGNHWWHSICHRKQLATQYKIIAQEAMKPLVAQYMAQEAIGDRV